MVCCRRSVLLAAWVLPALLILCGAGLVAAGSADARPLLQQCENGIDDDGDGKIDAPFDPGCSAANNLNAAGNDNNEADPVAPALPPACSNGAAPDFPTAALCAFAGDTDELGGTVTQCSNGTDDAPADGLTDFPADLDCRWAADPFETTRACSNGIDDDRPLDAFIDFPADIGCTDLNDPNESNPPQCNDGRDNDGDGTHDFNPAATRDADCASQRDNLEGPGVAPPECADGADNDGDGVADFPNDPGCSFAGDDDETDPTGASGAPPPSPPQCADTLDNDGDGRIDLADPGCSSASDNDETNTITFITQGPAAPPQSARLLAPFPIVRMRGSADKRGVRISLLTVRAPAASTVSIYCTGRGCPRKRVVITAGRAVVRVRQFEKRLRSGTILKVYVTKPGYIGKYTRFRLLRNRLPLRADRCVTKPGTKPRPCPSN